MPFESKFLWTQVIEHWNKPAITGHVCNENHVTACYVKMITDSSGIIRDQ